MSRWLVCGGREYADRATMFAYLGQMVAERGRPDIVIHGDARGADRMARNWARSFGIPVQAYPAKWGELGSKAGPIRNAQMLTEGKPTLVIAFPDTPLLASVGTKDMVTRARKAHVETLVVEP